MVLQFLLFITTMINSLSIESANEACAVSEYRLISGMPLYLYQTSRCLEFHMSVKYNTTIDVELSTDLKNHYVIVSELSDGTLVYDTKVLINEIDELYKFSYNVSFPSADYVLLFFSIKNDFFYINAKKRLIEKINEDEKKIIKELDIENIKKTISEELENIKKTMKIIFIFIFFILIIICFFIILTIYHCLKK